MGLSALIIMATVLVAIWLGMQRGLSPWATTGLGTIVFLGTLLLVSYGQFRVTGHNPVLLWQQQFNASLEASLTIYRQMGWSEDELSRAVRLLRLFFIDGIWAWLIVSAAFFSYGVYRIIRRVAPGLAGSTHPLTPMTHWVVPEPLIFILLLGMVAVLAAKWQPAWIGLTGMNILLLMGWVYLISGLSVVMYFFEKRGVSRFLKVATVVLVGFVPALLIFIILLGVFDTWWDWRRLRRPSQTAV